MKNIYICVRRKTETSMVDSNAIHCTLCMAKNVKWIYTIYLYVIGIFFIIYFSKPIFFIFQNLFLFFSQHIFIFQNLFLLFRIYFNFSKLIFIINTYGNGHKQWHETLFFIISTGTKHCFLSLFSGHSQECQHYKNTSAPKETLLCIVMTILTN